MTRASPKASQGAAPASQGSWQGRGPAVVKGKA